MSDTICTIIVAGAWSYRVVVTEDKLLDVQGRRAAGGFVPLESELLISIAQSADSALGTLAHEFVHAWRYHLDCDRASVVDAVRKLAKVDPELRRVLDDGPAESDATMLCCWLRECLRLDIVGLIAKRFGGMHVADVRTLVATAGAAAAAGDLDDVGPVEVAVVEGDAIRYLPDLDSQDWQRRLGQSGARCECLECGKTINAATVMAGEPRWNLRLRGQVVDCMFICDGCGTAVRWKSPHPIPANFDSSLSHDVEILRGRDADDAMLEILGPVVRTA